MQDFTMEGLGSISGGEFHTIKIKGVGNCSNNIKADSLNIEGVFNCSGKVEADYLYCGGVANLKANIRTKKMNVQGVITMDSNSKIEAAEIYCEGVIKTKGEIYADMLDAEGCIEANAIYGDRIKILSHWRKIAIINWFNKSISKIRLIEATYIEISGVKAETVNGNDIKIGPNCEIDTVDCSGILSIDSSSFVRNITGNYTKRD